MSRGLREVCRCGHDRESHFEKSATCLASFCDCPHWRDPEKPDTVARQRPKGHPHWCKCLGCREGMP